MKFSSRTSWPRVKNPFIETYQKYKDDGQSIIDLTESNPTRCDFRSISSDLLSAFSTQDNLTYCPDSQGLKTARETVANYYAKRNISVDPDNIFLTASTSEGYSHLFRLLTNPDDQVLFPTPSYPLFQFLTDLNDIKMLNYTLRYGQAWQIDFATLNKQITDRTKAIISVNPNNPTSSYIKREELVQLNAICQKHQLAIMCDEVFWDYSLKDDRDRLSLAGNADVLTFTLSGISKILGFPQMKLSWIVINGPTDLVDEAKQRLSLIADTYLSVSTPIQNAFLKWADKIDDVQNEIRERIRSNYAYLQQNVEEAKIEMLEAEGGWYVIVRLPEGIDEEKSALSLLNDHRVFVHPGYFFDFEDGPCWVLSLLSPKDVFCKGFTAIIQNFDKILQH